jgi:subfamily B ATP-binding cassette protein MsbA
MSDDHGMKPVSEWQTYKRLLRMTRPYASRLVIGILAGVVAGAAKGYHLLKYLYENLTNLELASSEGIAFDAFILTVLVLPLIFLVLGIAEYLTSYMIQWVGNRVVMDLRNQTFLHLQDLSVGYYNRQKTGELISRTINDTTMIEHAVSSVISDVAKQPVTLAFALGYLFGLDWKLAACMIIILPVSMMPVLLFGRRVRRNSREGQSRLGELVSIMQEKIGGIRIVKAFGMETVEVERFRVDNESYFRRMMKVVRAKAAVQPLIQMIAVFGFVAVWVYGFYRDLPLSAVITFGAGLFLMYEPVKKLGRIHLHIQQSSAAADRVFEILDTDVLVKDCDGATELNDPIQSIDFDNVQFAYEHEPVLRGINLKVKAGERVAFVGGSGAGKTTLINLIPRFYDVTGGAIMIDGKDIKSLTIQSLRSKIGMVTQDTVLFHDTIANNISYGMSNCTREDIEQAARRAHAHDFISAEEMGYDTVIGDRGVRLSGGQKQRICIARAILRNPPILILDEATSALDTESERQVQSALDELMEGRTVFAIAHRLSTITGYDRIIVLDHGKVIEEGTHEGLMTSKGAYHRLYTMAFED